MKSGLAKTKEEVGKAKEEFVPSTGDESYLQSKEVDTKKEASEINSLHDKGMYHAQIATEAWIDAGRRLLLVRTAIKGDLEFGRWTKANISFPSSTISRMMRVAKEYGNTENLGSASPSMLIELLSAPEEVKEEVMKDLEDGKAVTKKEVKEKKEKATAPVELTDEQTGGDPFDESDDKTIQDRPLPDGAIESIIQNNMQMNIHQRCAEFEEHSKQMNDEWCWFIIGLNPYFDDANAPNQNSVIMLISAIEETLLPANDSDEVVISILDRAEAQIGNYYAR